MLNAEGIVQTEEEHPPYSYPITVGNLVEIIPHCLRTVALL